MDASDRRSDGAAAIGTEPAREVLQLIQPGARDTFDFQVETLPRPAGKATQVIYTVYDLPRPDASPHDEVFDAQERVVSDFNSQFIGKLDPKTGKVQEYPIRRTVSASSRRAVFKSTSTKGRIYYANMWQMQIVRLDPNTGKFETFKPPSLSQRLAMGI